MYEAIPQTTSVLRNQEKNRTSKFGYTSVIESVPDEVRLLLQGGADLAGYVQGESAQERL